MITSMSWKAAHFGAVKTHKLHTDHISMGLHTTASSTRYRCNNKLWYIHNN